MRSRFSWMTTGLTSAWIAMSPTPKTRPPELSVKALYTELLRPARIFTFDLASFSLCSRMILPYGWILVLNLRIRYILCSQQNLTISGTIFVIKY